MLPAVFQQELAAFEDPGMRSAQTLVVLQEAQECEAGCIFFVTCETKSLVRASDRLYRAKVRHYGLEQVLGELVV